MHATRFMRAIGAALLAAISMMAIGSSAAQAELVVEGQPPAHRTLNGIVVGQRTLRATGGAQINCPNGGTILALALVDNIIHTTRLYEGCNAVGSNCPVYETSKEAALRINPGNWVEKTLAIFAESEGKHYLVSQESKEPIATLYFDELCALPAELKLTGTVAFKAPDILEKLVKHTLEPVSEKEAEKLKVGLTLGAKKAFLEGGKEELELTGKEAGLKWWLK